MIWVLRVLLAIVIVAYATWLALPLGAALAAGQTVGQVWSGLAATGSTEALMIAAGLLATIVLYGAGGLATAAGWSWAPGLFFLGFMGDIVLRLAVAGGAVQPGTEALEIGARAEAMLRPLGVTVETTPLTLAILLAVGLAVLATGVWRGQKGAALTRVWTEPPLWA
ncbi:hypothetical protein BZG35_02430 [Brevundimonas sp. LM2]|uniref:hypothetical protein n=1 Tax=Brevundimonas sp. LM2 TaxID=1938605 RepID=UPI000983D574|nr:hypothetical protein [Brevundimonas sp. LM2]AQR60630.1 hypothetical protein BZG35_02430 [Brevundimonas sp. LM2]